MLQHFLFVSLLVTISSTTLVSVISWQRHCARYHVPNYEVLTPGQTEGDVHCLRQGLEEAKQIGQYLAETYFSTLGITTYSPASHFFMSSNTDRSLQTLDAVVTGMFGDSEIIPKHANELNWDYKIRGFDKCSAFLDKANAWRLSTEFKTKEAETLDFRTRMAEPLKISADLFNWFNVYDAYVIQREYNALEKDIPVLSDADWQKVEEIMAWVSSRRYGRQIAGDLPGYGSLGEVNFRFASKIANVSLHGRPFVLYSGHYTTLMSLTASLGFDPNTPPANIVPDFLALLIFELHFDVDSYYVRMKYMNGGTDTLHDLPWPSSIPECSGNIDCPWTIFHNRAYGTTLGEFCTHCEDCDRFVKLITETTTIQPPGPSPEYVIDFPNNLYGAVVAIVVIVGVTLFVGIILFLYSRNQSFSTA